MHSKVDQYFKRIKIWEDEMCMLRNIILECGLTEEFKWGEPCYTYNSKNVVLIHGFKEYCAILFMKGVLLIDQKKILIQQTKNVQAARQIRFTTLEQILHQKNMLMKYILEAVEIEKKGLKFTLKKTEDFEIVTELNQKFKTNAAFKSAFYTLTEGRQRGYLLFFAAAKQSKTRIQRIEKFIPKILNGKGLQDK